MPRKAGALQLQTKGPLQLLPNLLLTSQRANSSISNGIPLISLFYAISKASNDADSSTGAAPRAGFVGCLDLYTTRIIDFGAEGPLGFDSGPQRVRKNMHKPSCSSGFTGLVAPVFRCFCFLV